MPGPGFRWFSRLVTIDRVKMPRTANAPCFVLRHVSDFNARSIPGLPDTHRATAEQESL